MPNRIKKQPYLVYFKTPGKTQDADSIQRSSYVSAEDGDFAIGMVMRKFPEAFDVGLDAPPKVEVPTHPQAKTPIPPERTQASGANAPQTPVKRPAVNLNPRKAMTGTAENDNAVRNRYPFIGDSVRVDIERVPRDKRKTEHQWCIEHGLHGAVGVVVGAEVKGSYQLLIETGSQRAYVPAECCVIDEPPPTEPSGLPPEERKAPEHMRKHSNGSYNLT